MTTAPQKAPLLPSERTKEIARAILRRRAGVTNPYTTRYYSPGDDEAAQWQAVVDDEYDAYTTRLGVRVTPARRAAATAYAHTTMEDLLTPGRRQRGRIPLVPESEVRAVTRSAVRHIHRLPHPATAVLRVLVIVFWAVLAWMFYDAVVDPNGLWAPHLWPDATPTSELAAAARTAVDHLAVAVATAAAVVAVLEVVTILIGARRLGRRSGAAAPGARIAERLTRAVVALLPLFLVATGGIGYALYTVGGALTGP